MAALLGALLVARRWVAFRTGAETLKSELFLYAAGAEMALLAGDFLATSYRGTARQLGDSRPAAAHIFNQLPEYRQGPHCLPAGVSLQFLQIIESGLKGGAQATEGLPYS